MHLLIPSRIRLKPLEPAQYRSAHPRMSSHPVVSIITPTANRHAFLPAIAQCVLNQTVAWEWLVHDDSPEPSRFMIDLCAADPRVRYVHHDGPRGTIGAKRNFLIGQARGELIAHFDDDDYYAPHYLADMIRIKQENAAHLIKLSDFYVYAPHADFFGYSDLNTTPGEHFLLTWEGVSRVDIKREWEVGHNLVVLYGFSCVYDRDIALGDVYENVDIYEDDKFMRKLIDDQRKIIAVDDRHCSCLHLVHPGSTASSFSRYSIPMFLLKRLFPGYAGYPLQTRVPT
jgi:glycosyltransferase involved in cell wall biosynthesis